MTVEKELPVELSKENKELLYKGIRPPGMPKDIYKNIMKVQREAYKIRKKGKMFYVASEIVEIEEPIEGSDKTRTKKVTKSYGPYKKPVKETVKN